MRTLASVAFAFILLSTFAQDRASIEAIGRRHVDTLASEYLHGRGYVNAGDSLAAEYIASEFKRIGLQPVKKDFFQPFQFNVNSFPDSMRVSIDGRDLQPGTEFLVDPHSGSAHGDFDVVHLTSAELLAPETRSMAMGVITGKAIHVKWPKTMDKDSLQLFSELERDLMHYGPVLKRAGEKLTWSVGREALPFPLIEIKSERFTDSTTSIGLSINSDLLVRRPARNVLGLAKGKGKGVIVIGAHYDHLGRMGSKTMFPGANDNASGTAMMLTLAEHFNKNPAKHDILFIAFAGEEAGLVGSEWCVTDRPIDWGDVKLMINLDILGTGDEGITVVNATEQKETFDRLVELNETGKYLQQVKSRGPACNSDHCPFVKRRIPAIFIYTLGGSAAYHDVHDRAEELPLTKFPEVFFLLRDFIKGMK